LLTRWAMIIAVIAILLTSFRLERPLNAIFTRRAPRVVCVLPGTAFLAAIDAADCFEAT
jgi:hypothetical protein